MKVKVIFLLVLIGITALKAAESSQFSNELYLFSHQWCRKCDKVINIMQKLQVNYNIKNKKQNTNDNSHNQVKFQFIHSYDDFLDPNYGQKTKNNTVQKLQTEKNIKISDKEQQKQQKTERIYQKINQQYGLDPTQIPYPTIWISCSYFEGFYQNQLSYQEIFYWIGVYCEGNLPTCTCSQIKTKNKGLNKNDYQFQISSLNWSEHRDQIISFALSHPIVKLCIHETKQISDLNHKIHRLKEFNQIEKEFSQGPLFFSQFDHNLRNYLYSSKQSKLAIFLLFNFVSHPKVKQFIDIYKFISDSLHGDTEDHLNEGKPGSIFFHNQSHKAQLQSQYHRSSLQNYEINKKKQIFKNIVFVGACYSPNKADCLMKYQYTFEQNKQQRLKDPNQKPILTKYEIPFSFKGTKHQQIKRLLQFSHMKNIFQSQDNQDQIVKSPMFQIAAFEFNKESHRINTYNFESTTNKLSNDFLFWIQNIYQHIFQQDKRNSPNGSQQSQQVSCLSSELIHYISKRNLTAIKSNIKITRSIEMINSKSKQKIKLKTVIIEEQPEKIFMPERLKTSKWKAEYFQLCIKNKPMKYQTESENVMKLLSQEFSLDLKLENDQQNKREKQKSVLSENNEL